MADTQRKPRPKRTGSKGSLFGDAETAERRKSQIVVLSSNFTIGPLLARGCLLPDALEGDAISDAGASTRLQWSTGPIPAGRVAALVASARNVIPIGIRLSAGCQVRQISVSGQPDPVECISVSDVEQLFFQNDKDRARFESLEFSNYALAATGLAIGVDAALFEGVGEDAARHSPSDAGESANATASAADGPGVAAPPGSALGETAGAIRKADCRAGLLAFLLTGSPGWRVWMYGVERLFAKKAKSIEGSTWPERIASAALAVSREATSVDDALLAAVVEVLPKYPVEGGWPGEQILAEIAQGAKARILSDDDRALREVTRWSERAADVLASKAEPQSLADNGYVIQRATLLLLLRGEIDGILEGKDSADGPLRPGPQVLGAATALAAMRTGLRALPARYKATSDSQAPGRLLAYLGETFLRVLQEPTQSSLIPPPLATPSIVYRSIRTLQGEWIVTISSKEVARTVAEFDRGLERLLTMGRHMGFEFEEHGLNGLVTQVTRPDGRRRPLYLDLLQRDKGGAVVRFSSPTLKLVGTNSRARLPREFLLDLLVRNSSPEMNCRFAIVDDDSVIVALVDQMLATLDEAELKQHIQHVAQVADEFELSRDVGKVSIS